MNISKIPIKKRIALELFRLYRKNSTKIRNLNYIFWETTLRCNIACKHCGSDCGTDKTRDEVVEVPEKDMPYEDFIRAIDEIKDIVEPNKTSIVFSGGEPLMRDDLELCGHELNKRGFPWGIVSNGLFLNRDRLISLLDAGLHAATISLDGLEASHNWMRGNPKSFKKATEAIYLLSKVDNIRYDVVTCVNQKNIGELEGIKKLLLSLGVKEWRLFTVFAKGRAKQYPELQLDNDQFKQVFEFIKKERELGEIKVNYGCEGFLGNYETEVRDNMFFCKAGVNVASILADGSISACPSLRADYIQGNIYKDNFKDVWLNRYEKYRDRSWTKTGQCETCKFYRYCEGSALHLRDEKTGELLFCHYERLTETTS